MHIIKCINVNSALSQGVRFLRDNGVLSASRNGPVLVSPVPVTTVYYKPQERVLFNALRDANPFFHLFEALWMLAGRNDSEFPARYAAQMAQYSDDGVTLNGAYGYRWRHYFGYDQLAWAVDELTHNPQSRRVVIAMWDGGNADEEMSGDFYKATHGSLDVPCNTHVYLSLVTGMLDLTVCCRSNDIVWGAYGANAVHFSILQEYIATALGCPTGTMYQISNNYHAYGARPDTQRLFTSSHSLLDDRYSPLSVSSSPLSFGKREIFDEAVRMFVDDPLSEISARFSSFIAAIARPMSLAHAQHKSGDTEGALSRLRGSRADWHVAGVEWLERRLKAKLAKEQT
jgi:thymidylate synthase